VSEATPKKSKKQRRGKPRDGNSRTDNTASIQKKPRSKSSDASKDLEKAHSDGQELVGSVNTPGFAFVAKNVGKRSPTPDVKFSAQGLSADSLNFGSEKKVSETVTMSFGSQAWQKETQKDLEIDEGDVKMDNSIHDNKNEDPPGVPGKSAFLKKKLDDIASEGSDASDREDATAQQIKKLQLKKLGLSSGSDNDMDRGPLTSERQDLIYDEKDL
jgi:hypothetical protein